MTTGFSAPQPADVDGRRSQSAPNAGPSASGRLQDRVHWGSVWAGVLVALPVYLVLQLLFFALSIIDLGVNGDGQSTTASVVSAVLALVAFFVGGLMAGSTAASRDSDEGLLHGVLTWAVGIVAILGAGLLGAGALLGSLSNATAQNAALQQQAGQAGQATSQIDPAQALQAAHQGAGWAALALGLTVLAAAAGGMVGQKTGATKR